MALGVSSARRLAAFPSVPSLAEAWLPEFDFMAWYGTIASADTPREIVKKLNAQINQSLASADLKTRMAGEGAIATPTSPEAFGQLIVREIAR